MSECKDIINAIRKKLINWYKQNGRDFPWRHTSDPYKIMIAEFMLHRTKAEQVVPVYLEFIKKYPDVISLSAGKATKIVKFTKHLGLHWRARHFISFARYVLENYNGEIPDTYDELRIIPGVGEYIAGVIMTVCYGKPAPVVDSNIARFINRFFNLQYSGEIRRKKKIVDISRYLFHLKNTRTLFPAIIDFTSTICSPCVPLCGICPLRRGCAMGKLSPSSRCS